MSRSQHRRGSLSRMALMGCGRVRLAEEALMSSDEVEGLTVRMRE